MSGVSETMFSVQHISCDCKFRYNRIKKHINQSKNRIMMNIGDSVKTYMIGVLVEMIVCRILVPVIVNVVRHVKLMNI